MSLKDIEKLKERVDKDPNSKLFVPLAEEYRKEGMLDEAISVLLRGVEQQPGYMSARVSLGKIYLEKGMLPEARSEFENVIKIIPDNLYAHKKLAELCRDTGDRDMAIRQYKTVLRLNALDEDAQTNLNELEGWVGDMEPAMGEEAAEEAEPAEEAESIEETAGIEESLAIEEPEPVMAGERPSEPAAYDEELAAFKDSLFGEGDADEAADSPGEEEAIALEDEEEFGIMEESDEGAASFGDIDDVLAVEEAPPEAVSVAAPSKPSAVEGGTTLDLPPAAGVSPVMSVADADRFVAAGDYQGAVGVYRRLLAAHPEDRKALQGAEELKTLLKLLGKDKEILIGNLNAFLEGINKRRDEFFRNS